MLVDDEVVGDVIGVDDNVVGVDEVDDNVVGVDDGVDDNVIGVDDGDGNGDCLGGGVGNEEEEEEGGEGRGGGVGNGVGEGEERGGEESEREVRSRVVLTIAITSANFSLFSLLSVFLLFDFGKEEED